MSRARQLADSADLSFDGTTLVVDETNNRVGIGTASPSGTLNLSNGSGSAVQYFDSSNGQGTIYFRDTSSTLKGQIESQNDGTMFIATRAAAPIQFAINNTERMRIDSAGRVTMPYQPMVHVAKNNGNFTASNGIWIGNRNDVNVGGHYNNSTGVFTAPVTGLYYFSFFILAQSGNNFDLGVRKNGSQYSEMDMRCNNGAVSHNFTLSGCALMDLSANDTADLYVNSNPGGSIYGSGLNGIQIMLVG